MPDERYLIVGTGKSGTSAAHLLKAKGKAFSFFDGNVDFDGQAFFAVNTELAGADVILGELSKEDAGKFSDAVLSPGIPLDSDVVKTLKECNVNITGEIELAFKNSKGSLCAITGTNGKTTTVSLTGEILKTNYSDVRVVGNIGFPYTDEALTTTEDTVTCAEISSFQLETADTFRPHVSAILNITPDHLNRHHTMEEYIRVKELIVKEQTKDDICVLNYEDEVLRKFGEEIKDRVNVVFFSSKQRLFDGYFVEDDTIMKAVAGETHPVMKVSELLIIGPHNWENAMAAMAVAEGMGVSEEEIVEACKNFHAVEHRIEYVCTKKGVKFYNDSKGTNPDAAIKAVEAMTAPTCLIGGGYDKGSSYDEWIASFHGKIKKLVLIGQTKMNIAECCRRHGFMSFEFADSLEEAVDICVETARPGENVLLSPACASWGMFKNFEVRGSIFKEYVKSLPEHE